MRCYCPLKCALRLTERYTLLGCIPARRTVCPVPGWQKALWYNCAELEGAEGGDNGQGGFSLFGRGIDRVGRGNIPLFQRAEGLFFGQYQQTFQGGPDVVRTHLEMARHIGDAGLQMERRGPAYAGKKEAHWYEEVLVAHRPEGPGVGRVLADHRPRGNRGDRHPGSDGSADRPNLQQDHERSVSRWLSSLVSLEGFSWWKTAGLHLSCFLPGRLAGRRNYCKEVFLLVCWPLPPGRGHLLFMV